MKRQIQKALQGPAAGLIFGSMLTNVKPRMSDEDYAKYVKERRAARLVELQTVRKQEIAARAAKGVPKPAPSTAGKTSSIPTPTGQHPVTEQQPTQGSWSNVASSATSTAKPTDTAKVSEGKVQLLHPSAKHKKQPRSSPVVDTQTQPQTMGPEPVSPFGQSEQSQTNVPPSGTLKLPLISKDSFESTLTRPNNNKRKRHEEESKQQFKKICKFGEDWDLEESD